MEVVIDSRISTLRAAITAALESRGIRTTAACDDAWPTTARADLVIVSTWDHTYNAPALVEAARSGTPVVALVTSVAIGDVLSVLDLGFAAAISIRSELHLIEQTIELVATGARVIPSAVLSVLIASGESRVRTSLSATDVRWLQFLAGGGTVASLAEHMTFSERETYRRLRRIYKGLGASRLQAALVAAERGGFL
jgi:DNA-binding NarL/FixJ family response regulator